MMRRQISTSTGAPGRQGVRTGAGATFLALIASVAAAAGPDCRAPGADCTLRQAAEQVGVRVGAAVKPDLLQSDPQYAPTLAQEFDSLTAENHMKWNAIHPALGVYEFGPADALADFAESHDMAIRGHTLIWDQQLIGSTPQYVKDITDPQVLRDLMAEHIQTVVGRYRGRVDAWDVVNEPLETGGTALYDNVFHRLLGPAYIAEALQLAHTADPDAMLVLNEVLISSAGPKFDAFLALVTDLKNAGVPLHGVGIQGHFIFAAQPDQLRANIETLAALGLAVELTEVDVILRGQDDLASKLERQRQEYFGIVSACMAVEACRRITMWGFTDRYTWIDSFFGAGLAPLPLDESYGRKPAYFGLRDGLLTRSGGYPVPLLAGPWFALAVVMLAVMLAVLVGRRPGMSRGVNSGRGATTSRYGPDPVPKS